MKLLNYQLIPVIVLAAFLAGSTTYADDGPIGWPGWRGVNRDGYGEALPTKLPTKPEVSWTYQCDGESLSGVSANGEYVVLAGRDPLDTKDVITCLGLRDGKMVWQHDYAALPPPNAETRDGRIDYGNSPRATPLIVEDRVITQGAFGDLYCLELKTGKVLWSLNYVLDFDAPIPTWGWSGTPLHHNGLLYIQPGATEASLVAVKIEDGEVEWEAKGGMASYTSPIITKVAGQEQVITPDSTFWGGFDAKTGKQIWRLKPEKPGEFLVPTALAFDDKVLLVGEVNGARLHSFDKSGKIVTKPDSKLQNFNPDTHTPVKFGQWIVGAHNALWLMSAQDVSKHQEIEESEFTGHCSVMTDGQRLMVLSDSGIVFLYGADGDTVKLVGKVNLAEHGSKIYAHPAWVEGHLIFREGSQVHSVKLR